VSALQLNLTEISTLVQLAFLVVITYLLLTDVNRFLWVCYVAVAAATVVGLVGLLSSFGLVSLSISEKTFEGYSRVTGFAGDPNKFAYLLLVPLGFAFNLVFGAKSRRNKVILWVAAAIIGGAIVSTYSAGAILGVGAVILTSVLLQWRVSAARGISALLLICVVVLVVAIAVPQDYVQVVKDKYTGISQGSLSSVGTGRGAAWEAAIRAIAANPILGSGMSTRAEQTDIAAHYQGEYTTEKAAHNTYLAIGVSTGIFGLVAFLVACVAAFKLLWSKFIRALSAGGGKTAVAASCLLTGLVVTLVQGLQLDLQLEKFPWLLLAAALASASWGYAKHESDAEVAEQ
jgi:O-antigen ligase